MKIATIIGARPQFIKASAVSQAIQKYNSDPSLRGAKRRSNLVSNTVTEIIIHTGQHYDYKMSKIFFDELNIPKPDYNLEVGSGTHGAQTGNMLAKIERVLLKERPDWILVYGDTNSTLAGALAASKLHIPVAHVEAGMRSFNRKMPEEINRLVTDHLATLHLCATKTAVDNLKREGIQKGVHLVGDVMYDACLANSRVAEEKSNILKKLWLTAKSYYLATVHRQSNTDNIANLRNIINAFSRLNLPVVFPVHPRTRKYLSQATRGISSKNFIVTNPVGYLDMLCLEKNAKKIFTDSGGVQKEAYFFHVPCITLRDETEWVETIETGWNRIVGTDTIKITKAATLLSPAKRQPKLFGNGKAGKKIARLLINR